MNRKLIIILLEFVDGKGNIQDIIEISPGDDYLVKNIYIEMSSEDFNYSVLFNLHKAYSFIIVVWNNNMFLIF